MPVTKTYRDCYEVRVGRRSGEWANITLLCWSRLANVGTQHEDTYYCGEITIHSSFGCWGHIWTACSNPFKEFLIEAEFGYVFTKFMGQGLWCFDGEGTLQAVRATIIEDRRHGGISAAQAREAWDAVLDESARIECSEFDCGEALLDIARNLCVNHPLHDYFADPSAWPRVTRADLQAQSFWREIWPLFIDALKAEVSADGTAGNSAATDVNPVGSPA